MLQMQVYVACLPWLFSFQTFFQEVEMDFHRNAHGKSRLKRFPVSGSLFALVASKFEWSITLDAGCQDQEHNASSRCVA